VFVLADDLTAHIRTDLNVGGEPARRIADVSSNSPEAYRLYVDGVEAIRNFRRADARRLFEQAIAIDPHFASAYFQLVGVAQQIGDRAAMTEYRTKMRENIDRLPERQRMVADATEASEAGDHDKTVQILDALIAKYPDEEIGYVFLGGTWELKGDVSRAFATYQQGIKAIPSSGPLFNNYGYALLRAGRYPEAIRQFEEYARLAPKEPNPYDSMAEAYIIGGQPDKALDKYARVLEIDPSFYNAHGARAWAFSILGRYDEARAEQDVLRREVERSGVPPGTVYLRDALISASTGRYGEMEANIARTIAAADRTNAASQKTAAVLLGAHAAIERGDYVAAVAAADRVQQTMASIENAIARHTLEVFEPFISGVARARAGRLADARTKLEQLTRLHDAKQTNEKWWRDALEAEIALAGGDARRGDELYTAASPVRKMDANADFLMITAASNDLAFPDGPARAKKARGDIDGAIGAYRQLITPDIASKWTLPLNPRYVLELARLYEQKGDAARAREHYRRFLDLWKNADAGLPELAEARRKAS